MFELAASGVLDENTLVGRIREYGLRAIHGFDYNSFAVILDGFLKYIYCLRETASVIMCLKILKEFDPALRTPMYKEVFAHIIEEAYYITLPQGVVYTAWWPWLEEYNGEINAWADKGSVMSHIWLDQDLREEMTGRR